MRGVFVACRGPRAGSTHEAQRKGQRQPSRKERDEKGDPVEKRVGTVRHHGDDAPEGRKAPGHAQRHVDERLGEDEGGKTDAEIEAAEQRARLRQGPGMELRAPRAAAIAA